MAQLEVGLHNAELAMINADYLPILMHAAGIDYAPVSRSLMRFNAHFATQVVQVYIIDDYIVEQSEIINLTLVSTDSAVILNPSTSTITIEDVDSKLLYVAKLYMQLKFNLYTIITSVVTIGFSWTAYSMNENAGSVSVTVSVQTGTLDRDVIVTLSTINGSALCESLKPPYPNG